MLPAATVDELLVHGGLSAVQAAVVLKGLASVPSVPARPHILEQGLAGSAEVCSVGEWDAVLVTPTSSTAKSVGDARMCRCFAQAPD